MPLRTETPLDVPVQKILAASTADEGLGPWWVLALGNEPYVTNCCVEATLSMRKILARRVPGGGRRRG